MTAALLCLGLALLLVAALLVRQVGLTRNANEGLAEWRRRYERVRRDHAALLKRYRVGNLLYAPPAAAVAGVHRLVASVSKPAPRERSYSRETPAEPLAVRNR